MPQTPPPPAVQQPPHLIAARTLQAELEGGKSTSRLLHTQAALLDALFAGLLDECIETRLNTFTNTPYKVVKRENIELALRAQKQCRQTLDCLAMRTPDKSAEQTESP
ncbi:MAG: hypothetical protein KGQ41_08735 [Alphaproteobacteria bacterium]|nr:hypothetical protein [Alphaproteobacteria bacterium]